MTEKTAEPENFEGKHVPLSAEVQRFFELIVQRAISTLQFSHFPVIYLFIKRIEITEWEGELNRVSSLG